MIVEHFFRTEAGELMLYEYADKTCPSDPEVLRKEASALDCTKLEVRVNGRRAFFERTETGWVPA